MVSGGVHTGTRTPNVIGARRCEFMGRIAWGRNLNSTNPGTWKAIDRACVWKSQVERCGTRMLGVEGARRIQA